MNDLVSVNIAAWLGCLAFLVILANGVLKLVDRATGRRANAAPQPFQVEHVKEFARHADLQKHVDENHRAHENIFAKLGGVERGARSEMQGQILQIQTERAASMVKLNDQFTFIRESLSAINRELELKRQ